MDGLRPTWAEVMKVLVRVGIQLPESNSCIAGEGSGVVVSPRHVLTAWHVVEERLDQPSYILHAITNEAGDGLTIITIEVSRRVQIGDLDLCLLEVPIDTWTEWAPLSATTALANQWLDIYGQGISSMEGVPILFPGFIHAHRRTIFVDDKKIVIEHPLNNGMSGGPAFNAEGELVGIQFASVIKERAMQSTFATWAISYIVNLATVRTEILQIMGKASKGG